MSGSIRSVRLRRSRVVVIIVLLGKKMPNAPRFEQEPGVPRDVIRNVMGSLENPLSLEGKKMPNAPQFDQEPRTSRDVIRNVMGSSEKPLPLEVVEQRLARSGYVAFGAEPIDAIDSAIESGLLKFNASDNTVKWTG